MIEFWRSAHKRTLDSTLRVIGFGSIGRALVALGIAVIYLLCVWYFVDPRTAEGEALLGVLGYLAPILFLPFVYLVQLLRILPRIHDEMQQERDEIQSRLNDLIESRSRLRLEFQSVFWGGSMEGSPDTSCVICLITVSNVGNFPSAARNWRVQLILRDAQHDLQLAHVPEVNVQSAGGGSARFTEADAIYNKTFQPVPVGGMAQGYILASVASEVCGQIEPGDKVAVTCEDIHGRESMCEFTLNRVVDAPRYLPGMMHPIWGPPS